MAQGEDRVTDQFRISTPPVSRAQALKFADQIEREIGEVANGARKPGRLDLEALARLVTFARNDTIDGMKLADEIQDCFKKADQPLHDEQYVMLVGFLSARGLAA